MTIAQVAEYRNCGYAGTGRQHGFRFRGSKERVGSNPTIRTKSILTFL